MRQVTLTIYTIAIAITASAQKLDRSIKPQPGPAPEIKLGKSESFTLPNGLRVFVVENHKLPVVAYNIQFDIKPELEGNATGYREMMSELLLAGTNSRSKDKLNAEIDKMGANFNVSSEGINASGLKKYQDKVLELMADIVMNANIPQSELDAVKKKSLSGLETQKNDPDAMVNNVSAVVNFGNKHPYGEVASEESIKNITLENCTKYFKTYFRPNVAYMAIVGDVTVNDVKPLVEKYFGSWVKQDVAVANYSLPEITGTKMTKVAFAPRIAAVQSVVSVTYPVDLKPGTADVIKARVANTILGGGSQGRLFLDLREKHAWTYGAYSALTENELAGSFEATVKCRNKVSDSAIEAILTQMKAMQTETVSDTTMQNAITYLSGGFAIGLEDPKRVAQYAINIERYHMPKDFYQNYLKNLSAVTAADVMEVSKKYIQTEHANIVVAGSKEEVANKLARFSGDGKIDYYDNVGRPIKPQETKAVAGNITAKDVFQKYITAIGGENAISAIKTIKTISTGEFQNIPLTITEIKKAPGMVKSEITGTIQGNAMTFQKQVFDGTKGYQEQQGQKAELGADEIAVLKEEGDLYADLHPEKYGIVRTLKGIETINGNDAYLIEAVNARKKTTKEYYDVQTGLRLREIETQETEQGPLTQTVDYSDYKEVPGSNGYKMPYSVSQSGAGPTMVAKVQSVEINKNIADTEFK
jgi:predicted Zn-dependent peptidase